MVESKHGKKHFPSTGFSSTGQPAKPHGLFVLSSAERLHKMCLSSKATSHRECFVPRQLIEKTPLGERDDQALGLRPPIKLDTRV